MTKILMITMLLATPALFAAETNAPALTMPTNSPPAFQVELVEQARLVAEIGFEAAKGFDPETHARDLRAQMEALITRPTAKPPAPADAVENSSTPPDRTAKPPTTAASATATIGKENTSTIGPAPSVLKEAIRKLRVMADELENQVEKPAQNP